MDDIITIGSAIQDVFIKTKRFEILENEVFGDDEKGICLPLGSKVPIEKLVFASGGAGTNTAVTFARFGLSVSFLGKIGQDFRGEEIKKELKKENVATSLIIESKDYPTAYSVILSTYQQGRTILVFRGASGHLQEKDIDFSRIKTKWLYIASLGGNLNLIKKIVTEAEKKKIKIAFNPGQKELKQGLSKLKEILARIDVLILNKEEASLLTGISFQKENEIVKKTTLIAKNIGVITKGREGLVAFDKEYLYRAGTFGKEAIEPTGAGDAFGSAFVYGILKEKGLEFAIRLGSLNATSVIQKIGAKNGILRKIPESELSKLAITKEKL